MKRCGADHLRSAERFALVVVALVCISCGKTGPPLPPLVRIPAPPTDLVAERRGSSVDVTLTVPSANADLTRPANVERVELYAISGPPSVTDEQLVKLGSKVGSVDVKAPRDPNATVEPDDPASDAELPEGKGLDQGAKAAFKETLTAAQMTPVDLSSSPRRPRDTPAPKLLTGPPLKPPVRVYAGTGITTRGRRGPFSSRAAVPLVPPPPPPSQPQITYDETAITVTWTPPPLPPPVLAPATGDVLPARVIGLAFPATGYNVYEIRTSPEAGEIKLTNPPVTEPTFVDKRIEWGRERCYAVRVAEIFDPLSIESDASPARCATLTDTFPPKAPTGAQAVGSEGAISLIWDPNSEQDLGGYIVLRGALPSETLTPVTPAPIQETTLRDAVQPGVRYVYAVQAVDKAGNRSALSNRTEPTEAR